MTNGELFKIIGIGIIGLVCYLITKPIKPELAIFISIATACLIFIFCVNGLSNILNTVVNLFEKTGINNGVFATILKIIGIGYLIEFSASICTDAGCGSLSDKIAFAGKICILGLSLPIITNLLNIIIEILP